MNLTFFEPRTVKVPSVVFAFAFTSFAWLTIIAYRVAVFNISRCRNLSDPSKTLLFSMPPEINPDNSLHRTCVQFRMFLVDPPVYDNRVQHAFYPKELQQFLTGFIIQAHQKHTLVIVLFTFTQNSLPGLRLSMLLMNYMFGLFWSVMGESDPRPKIGNLLFCH